MRTHSCLHNVSHASLTKPMLAILDHIRKLLLNAAKRYSPARLLQHLIALCRAVCRRYKSKRDDWGSSHELLSALTITERNGPVSEESQSATVRQTASESYPPAPPQASTSSVRVDRAANNDISPCVRNQVLCNIYANNHLLQAKSNRINGLDAALYSKAG